EPERYVGSPAGDVAGYQPSKSRHALPAKAFAEWMLRNGFGQSVIRSPVVEPSADQTRSPQNHARYGGIPHSPTRPRTERFKHRLRFIMVQEWMTQQQLPSGTECIRSDGYDRDIGHRGSELGPDDLRGIRDDRIQTIGATMFAHDGGQCRRRHGRLLGR